MKQLLAMTALFLAPLAHGQVRCADVHSPLKITEKLADKNGARVMAYNLMNLFDHVGAFDQKQAFKMTKRKDSGKDEPRPKTLKQQQELAEAFHEMNADFAIVTEVENINALKTYTKKNLRDAYDSYLTEGNDPRGIDIGLLVKKGLKVKIESRTHKSEMWNDPVTQQSIPLFSRDLPIWIAKDAASGKTMMALVGMHSKSKRDRDGDPESKIWRSAQIEKGAEIVENLSKELGKDVPVLWGGDFNTDLVKSPEAAPIKKVFRDVLDVAQKTKNASPRVTHTFHPRNGGTDAKQMDGIFVNLDSTGQVLQAQIYRYKDESGQTKAIPKSFGQREQNPSDHFPVVVDIER